MRVKDLMSTPAQTCYVDTDLGTVGGMMQEHDLGFIPVVSAARKVVGLVTDRDICMWRQAAGWRLCTSPPPRR